MFVEYNAKVYVTDDEEIEALRTTKSLLDEVVRIMSGAPPISRPTFGGYSQTEVQDAIHIMNLLLDSVNEGGILIS